MRTHEQNLQCIRHNVTMFEGYAKNGSARTIARLEELRQAEADYLRFMAGEIERREMCHTAIELTMEMPAWGTYGT